jgi:hypothetical protein
LKLIDGCPYCLLVILIVPDAVALPEDERGEVWYACHQPVHDEWITDAGVDLVYQLQFLLYPIEETHVKEMNQKNDTVYRCSVPITSTLHRCIGTAAT